MSFFHKPILVFMMLWLPLSGAMAVVMPLSGGTAASQSDASVTVTSSMPCHDADATADTTKSGTCTHCVLCHLATSLMMPSLPVLPTLIPSHHFMATPLLSHTSFIPEPASPPPRTLAS